MRWAMLVEGRGRVAEIVIGHLRQMRWMVAGAAIVSVAATVAALSRPWPLKIIFDHVLSDQPLPGWLGFLGPARDRGDTPLIAVLAITIVVIALLVATLEYVQTMIATRVGHRLVARIRAELFDHLQDLPLTFHQRARRGELITKAVSDTQKLKETFSEHAMRLVSNALTLVGILIVMALVNWRLTMIPLVSLPLLGGLYLYFQRHLKESVRVQRSEEGRLNTHLAEILGSMSIVQAFGREAHEAAEFRQNNAANVSMGIRSTQIGAAMEGAIGLVSSAGLALVVFFGAVGVNAGTMTLGELLVFTTYVRTIYRPIKELVKLTPKLTRSAVASGRINQLFEEAPGVQDAPGAEPVGVLAGSVEFEQVSFAYEDHAVLRDVSFNIKPGDRVALVGPSGAGKTTVASLILRLYEPDAGEILVDGRPITAFQRTSLRQQIGYVPQDSLLVGLSIAENIAYGRPGATTDEIAWAARQANIAEHIESLPEGYETVLGETGSTVSGGQRQRIAIARALLKEPSMLILDEPTSSLDAASRAEVIAALTDLHSGATIIAITHDPELAAAFERRIELVDGRVEGEGAGRQEPQQPDATHNGSVDSSRASSTDPPVADTPDHLVVVGQGYVGLPVAIRAVQAGFQVTGFDIDEARVEMLERGESFVGDVSDLELSAALAGGRYRPSSDPDDLADFDVAVISVPTPLREGGPDLTFVAAAGATLASRLRIGATVILESTTYPGTTEELLLSVLEEGSGLKAGIDFALGYSPERINPGDGVNTFVTIPKVVSGYDEASLRAVEAFYGRLVDRTVTVGSTRVAELTKLLENTFRHVNIALINELAMFAHDLDIDVWEAIDAADTKPFGFMAFRPGPGVGGHCLPVDPSYLSWSVRRSLGRSFRFVELANDINEHMPDYVISRVVAMLNERYRALRGQRVLLVGMAYKANTGDARESPSMRIAAQLVALGADVQVADPHVRAADIPPDVGWVDLSDCELREADVTLLLVAHDSTDLEQIQKHAQLVLDCTHRLEAADHVHHL